jgi:uncharacterized protein YukE
MSFSGASTDELRALAGEISTKIATIEGRLSCATSAIHDSGHVWQGYDADAFRCRWDSSHHRQVHDALDWLRSAERQLRVEATEQDLTSSAATIASCAIPPLGPPSSSQFNERLAVVRAKLDMGQFGGVRDGDLREVPDATQGLIVNSHNDPFVVAEKIESGIAGMGGRESYVGERYIEFDGSLGRHDESNYEAYFRDPASASPVGSGQSEFLHGAAAMYNLGGERVRVKVLDPYTLSGAGR